MPTNNRLLAPALALLAALPMTASSCPDKKPQFTALAAGAEHTCAVTVSKSVVCWGKAGVADSPSVPKTHDFVSLAARGDTTCGLKTDQSVECWGDDKDIWVHSILHYVPYGERFTAISLGQETACGLKTDRSILCWGNLDTLSQNVGAGSKNQVAIGGKFIALGAGPYSVCGVRKDGTASCWGSTTAFWRNALRATTGVTALVLDGPFAYELKKDGSLHFLNLEPAWYTPPTEPGGFAQIAAGSGGSTSSYTLCGILAVDGSPRCWSRFTDSSLMTTSKPPTSGRFKAITAGGNHACGLKSDGSIECWGDNTFGQLNVPKPDETDL